MSATSIYDGLEERERLFTAYQAQDRRVWADFKEMVEQKNERIKALEGDREFYLLENRVTTRKLCEAEKLIECLRNVLKNIVSDFPKCEWKNRTTYRIACEYANGKTD